MKKLTILLSLLFIIGCSSKSKFEDPIKAQLIKDALGVDIKPKFNTLKVIDTVYVKESKENWYVLYSLPNQSKDSARAAAVKALEYFKELYDNDPANNNDHYKSWRWINDRITSLDKRNDNDVDYYVLKTNYTFFNPLLNQRISNDRVFILSDKFEVLYAGDEDNWKKIENEYTKTPLLKYEIAMYFNKEDIQY